jgi:O-antigen ligase
MKPLFSLGELQGWQLAAVGLFLLVLPAPPLFYNGSSIVLALGGVWLLLAHCGSITSLPSIRFLGLIFACLWLPMLIASVDAIDSGRAWSGSLLYARFGLSSVLLVWLATHASALTITRACVLLFCALWVFDALIQATFGFNLLGFPNDGAQLKGIFYPRLQLGVVLTIFTPLILDELAKRATRNTAWWLCLVPLFAVIGFTLHRNSWLALATACAMYLLYQLLERGWRPRKQTVIAALVVLGVTAGALSMSDFVKSRVSDSVGALFKSTEHVEAQLGQRPDIWRAALNMLDEHWLNGIGPRGFRGAYADYAEPDDFWRNQSPPLSPSHPHQLTLEILAETGALGGLGYVLLLCLLGYRYRSLNADARAVAAPWLMCTLIAIWPLNIHKAFYGYFFATLAWWVLAISIASLFQPRSTAKIS